MLSEIMFVSQCKSLLAPDTYMPPPVTGKSRPGRVTPLEQFAWIVLSPNSNELLRIYHAASIAIVGV